MEFEIQIILDRLRNIESTEGSEAITEEKINEICKIHGVGFEEFRSSVLKMLADEAGVSADELESLSFEEINERDLDKISGGAINYDTVKRGAASLMAILNLGSMASSYAAAPNSDRVGVSHKVTLNEECDDDKITEEQAGLSKEAVKKWAKRLGIPVAVALLLISTIGVDKLKNSNAPADKVRTISVQDLNKISWKFEQGDSARCAAQKIFRSNETDKPSLRCACYVHITNSAVKNPPLYIVGSCDSEGGKSPKVLISDDMHYYSSRQKIGGIVQVFDDGLHKVDSEIKNSIVWGLKKNYVIVPWNDSVGKDYDSEIKRLTRGKKVTNDDDIPIWNLVLKEETSLKGDFVIPTGGNTIANAIGNASSGYEKYYVHLSNDYVPEKGLRIVGISDDKKSLLISDDYSYIHSANGARRQQTENFEGTDVMVYYNVSDLVEDGIIAGLRSAYRNMKGMGNVPAPLKPQLKSAVSNASGSRSSWLSWNPGKSIMNYVEEIYNNEYHRIEKMRGYIHPSKIENEEIIELQKKRLAVHLSPDLSFEQAQDIMNAIKKRLHELKKDSKYFKETQKKNWQCWYASTVFMGHPLVFEEPGKTIENTSDVRFSFENIFNTFGFSTAFDDLALGILATENLDNLGYYINSSNISNLKTKDFYGRTSGKYTRLFKDKKGKWRTLKQTPEEVMNARAGMLLNLTLKTLTKNGRKEIKQGLLKNIIENKTMIEELAEKIQKMNAYHQCSDDTFKEILESKEKFVCSKYELSYCSGLNAVYDLASGSDKTVFSIMGGNKEAIKEYALKGSEKYGRGCILEIPKECVSYVAPYALISDANPDGIARQIRNAHDECEKEKKYDPFAIVKGKEGIELPLETGIDGINVAQGLIALADSPLIRDSWDGAFGASKVQANQEVVNGENPTDEGDIWKDQYRQQSQMLRSRKLDPSNKKCATALAIYMFCQHVILNNGNLPNSADEVLETIYTKVGSHACMEGHSPGKIPLGTGGIERVLMINCQDDDCQVIKARRAGLKVNCIEGVPKTRTEFIKAFEDCR